MLGRYTSSESLNHLEFMVPSGNDASTSFIWFWESKLFIMPLKSGKNALKIGCRRSECAVDLGRAAFFNGNHSAVKVIVVFGRVPIFLWLCENGLHIFFTPFEFRLPIAKANTFHSFCLFFMLSLRVLHCCFSLSSLVSRSCRRFLWLVLIFIWFPTVNWVCASEWVWVCLFA